MLIDSVTELSDLYKDDNLLCKFLYYQVVILSL